MIKIEKVHTMNWEAAVRGMRNPMNSWDKSDSEYLRTSDQHIIYSRFEVGENDLDLMQRLKKAGRSHRKYARMIMVSMDVTAPLYWWKEFDTYKVGTAANSCSTMHKIHTKEFAVDDFSCEHLDMLSNDVLTQHIIPVLNINRNLFIEKKDKKYWWQMIQLLPSSYNQKRTITLSYEVLNNIYGDRKNHKLDEWREFCKWIETLPYAKELIMNNN